MSSYFTHIQRKVILTHSCLYTIYTLSYKSLYVTHTKSYILRKLDGVGPVDNRHSTDQLNHLVQKFSKKFSSPALTEKDDLMTDKGVYSTAPATPGLVIISRVYWVIILCQPNTHNPKILHMAGFVLVLLLFCCGSKYNGTGPTREIVAVKFLKNSLLLIFLILHPICL